MEEERCNLALFENSENKCSTLLQSTVLRKFYKWPMLHISLSHSQFKNQIPSFFSEKVKWFGLKWIWKCKTNFQVPISLLIQETKLAQCIETLFEKFEKINGDNLILIYSSCFIPPPIFLHLLFNLISLCMNTLFHKVHLIILKSLLLASSLLFHTKPSN